MQENQMIYPIVMCSRSDLSIPLTPKNAYGWNELKLGEVSSIYNVYM